MFRVVFVLLVAVVGIAMMPSVALAQSCAADTLKSQLLQREATDQAARKALMTDPKSNDASAHVLQVDRVNTAYMRKMVAECGWPKRSEVGKRAARAAWLLTQHADMDPQYQVVAAQELKYAVLGGEANPLDLAVLVDRNRRLTDRPQIYGLQFMVTKSGTIRFYDIVTPSLLGARRKQIGLVPFYCFAMTVSKQQDGAPIEWPAGVLVTPRHCDDTP